MKKLIIYGAGGLGREVKSMLSACTEDYQLIGFLDDGLPAGTHVQGVAILGGISQLVNFPTDAYLVVAIGNPKVKRSILSQIKPEWNIRFATLQHKRSCLQDSALIHVGEGSIVCAGAVLTTGIAVGSHVLINLNATIGHDSAIGSCSSIMPNVSIAGEVTVGEAVMIGSGANVINRIVIGDGAVIGAGSVVNHNIPQESTAAGVPARVIK